MIWNLFRSENTNSVFVFWIENAFDFNQQECNCGSALISNGGKKCHFLVSLPFFDGKFTKLIVITWNMNWSEIYLLTIFARTSERKINCRTIIVVRYCSEVHSTSLILKYLIVSYILFFTFLFILGRSSRHILWKIHFELI